MTRRATLLAVVVIAAACTDSVAPPQRAVPEDANIARAAIIAPTVVYSANFDTGIPGPEWSVGNLSVSPSGQSFLGEFLNDTATLTLDDLPGHSRVRVDVDVYIIRSWDGSNQF